MSAAPDSWAAETIDPLGGSYYVESLTDDLEEEAFELIEKVDQRGGMRNAIEDQWVQRQIQDTAFERQQEIENGERIIVGVNEFTVEEEDRHVDIEEVSEAQQQTQETRLKEVRQMRDDEEVAAKLDALESAARGEENLMPYIVDAVKVYATTGEICDAMRTVFGEYQPGASL